MPSADPARGGVLEEELVAVEHQVAAAVALGREARLGLRLLQDDLAEAARIRVTLLEGGRAGTVGLAGGGVDDRGLSEVFPCEQVVLELGGRVVEGVAVAVADLAHDRGLDDHAESVEFDGLAVAVRVRDEGRREEAVIVGDGDGVAERVGRRLEQEAVGVVGEGRDVAEQVARGLDAIEQVGVELDAARGAPPPGRLFAVAGLGVEDETGELVVEYSVELGLGEGEDLASRLSLGSCGLRALPYETLSVGVVVLLDPREQALLVPDAGGFWGLSSGASS